MSRLPAFAVDGAWATGQTLRTVAYAATSGQVGVIAPDAMRVTPNGSAVNIGPGAAVAPTRYVSSPSFNSYILTSTSTEQVSIPATGSGGGATRYIIARVDDPEFGGQGDPYAIFWRYEMVSSITNLAYPFVPLAKIVQPASTTTITSGMITDLRQVANPRRRRDTYERNVEGHRDLTSQTFVDWPPESSIDIYVPEWATRAIVRCDLLEIMLRDANADGRFVLMLGGQPAYTGERRWDEVWKGTTERTDATIVSSFTITDDMRDKTWPLRIRARRLNGTGYLRADGHTQVIYDVEFIEEAS